MKRFFAIILALAAVCSVCACERLVPSRQGTAVTDTSESSRTDEPAQAPQTDEITEAASSEADTEEEDAPELPIRVGEVYKNAKQGYFSDPYIPSLTLDADGGFTLIENLAEGMGTYEGRYSVVGGELVLTVEKTDFLSYAGDSVKEIRFVINSEDSLTLETALCLSFAGDVFRIQNGTDAPELPIRVGEVYKNTKQGYFSDPYIPSLTLDADGGFTLIENLAEGMGTYEGRYSVVGGELVLTVEKTDFLSYAGDSVKEIRFVINSEDSLTLETALCLSFAGDVFSSAIG